MWDYTEHLIIDRESESLEYIQNIGTGYKISRKYEIEGGDLVLVPAGKDNHETVVEVVRIEYFSKETVPLPIEKTKRIIRKCTDDDLWQ